MTIKCADLLCVRCELHGLYGDREKNGRAGDGTLFETTGPKLNPLCGRKRQGSIIGQVGLRGVVVLYRVSFVKDGCKK